MGRRTKKGESKGKTHITVVQDRSGSMHSLVESTIKGYNDYVSEVQKSKQGDVLLTLIQFDDYIDNRFVSKPIDEVEELTTQTFQPRGMTRLNDAVMTGVIETKPRVGKNDGVVLVIMTDGGENSSKEYAGHDGSERVKAELAKLSDEHGWDVVYLGAGPGAWQGAEFLGIALANTLNYAGDAQSHQVAYASLSNLTRRKSASPLAAQSFTADEKAATEGVVDTTSLPVGVPGRRRGSGKDLRNRK